MDKPNTVNKAALVGYLEKVINDSYKAEEKENDGSFEAWLIENKALLLILHCKYLRVTRRIYYRLSRNLYKNFGLSLVTMDRSVDPAHAGIDDITPEDFHAVSHYAETGRTVAYIKSGKNRFFLYPSLDPAHKGRCGNLLPDRVRNQNYYDGSLEAYHKALLDAGHDLYYYDNLDTAFETCKKAYEDTFHEPAPEVQTEQLPLSLTERRN